MRVFACEYVTGGGFVGDDLTSSLYQEGDLMMRHLVDNLTQVESISLLSARDHRLPLLGLHDEAIVNVGMDCWEEWKKVMSTADAVWPIAPERCGLLHRMSTEATRMGKILLGTRPAGVALSSSKYQTTRCLQAKGVPAVPTMYVDYWKTCRSPANDVAWVAKPDDGVGAEDVVLFTNREALLEFTSDRPGFVVQLFLSGQAVSLSLLCHNRKAVLLACNRQVLSVEDGRFHYKSWIVCGAEDRRSLYSPIAQAVAEAIPGLWGYVGVDLIDTGEVALVLEINPRLTTPYVGLSEAVGLNIGAAVISMATTGTLPLPRYCREVEVRLH